MDRYAILPMNDEDNGYFFCVWENDTELAIDFFYFEEDANKCAKFMSSGGAFAGFTPEFMLTYCGPKKSARSINSTFASTFK